jgi:type IV secretory pathway ATPase VirB11/archaellum biosynthesis ATPase
MKWYGRYEQAVRITVGEDAPFEIPLREQQNVVELKISEAASKSSPVRVMMTFRYHFVFDYAPTRLIAAFLKKAEIIDS